MSDQRDLSEDARVLAKIYSTQFYRRVDGLARNASGVVYDPSRGPAPPSPELKPFQPAPPRPDTPRPSGPPSIEIPGRAIVNENFQENVRRVLGDGYVNSWSSLGDMTMRCIDFVRGKKQRGRSDKMWGVREIQIFARLSVWGVHKHVIEALIEWPREWFTPEEAPIYYATIEDELRYIPVTPQQAQAGAQQASSSGQ
ncbi:hypothetical protein BFJ72_g3735 [Fusarium proliferatum]|uniref:Uncharacterized protein n=1 Tax=Gibberella intermedia TaxID=948311 RepID=A0A420TU14_GIBIN|nr:hypothetical protein BFJ72_g3735 [Fusarium proliferatum]